MTTSKPTVPARAMAFTGELAFAAPGEEATSVRPGKIVARTGGAAQHWYWGRCVHDLSGMQLPKDRVPLDYCHDYGDIVGFAEGFTVGKDGLTCDASLVSHRSDDRAGKLMADMDAGVPYEASILQASGGLVLEWVEPGAETEVNGQKFNGPLLIFRQWALRGLAICPQGADGATSAQFSAGPLSGDVTIPDLPGGFSLMTTATPPAPAAPATAPAPAAAPAAAAGFSQTAPTPAAPTKTGPQFMEAFGEKGAVWFAQGKTFDEARDLFYAGLTEDNKALKAKVEELSATITSLRGASEPVGFSGAAPDEAKGKGQGFASLITIK